MNIYEPLMGTNFRDAVKEAIELFKYEGNYDSGKIKFNGLLIPFSIYSNIDDIYIIYNLMHQLRTKN